jgi:hypothetical protein
MKLSQFKGAKVAIDEALEFIEETGGSVEVRLYPSRDGEAKHNDFCVEAQVDFPLPPPIDEDDEDIDEDDGSEEDN